MNLSAATALAGSQARYVSEVYKLFNYKDDQTLRDYLEFVIHEPAEWLKGFPAKLTSKAAFSRPKTALLKLLKHEDVQAELGAEFTKRVHDLVWTAFKKNADAIVAKRSAAAGGLSGGPPARRMIEESDTEEEEEEEEENEIQFEIAEETESVHSVRLPRKPSANAVPAISAISAAPALDTETRYKILEAAYLDLLSEFDAANPGLTASARRLLSALSRSPSQKATEPASPSASSTSA